MRHEGGNRSSEALTNNLLMILKLLLELNFDQEKQMKLSTKVSSLLVTMGCFFASEAMQKLGPKCPDLNQKEMRRLCRWEGFSKIPLLKIQSGSLTKEGITLLQNQHSCGEGDSFRAYFKTTKETLFSGTFTPVTVSERTTEIKTDGTCTYTLPKFTSKGGVTKSVSFDVQATQKAVHGFDMASGKRGAIAIGEAKVRAADDPAKENKHK